MNEQLERIKAKLKQLCSLDVDYKIFGADEHRYRLHPPLTKQEVHWFEAAHKIALPAEYVAFITQVCNGGAGPYYGLECLHDSISDLYGRHSGPFLNPSKPFVHTEDWNMEFRAADSSENEERYSDRLLEFDQGYYDKEWMNGAIAICKFGCGVTMNLVVNGLEYGNIWTDDRGSGNGIYPSYDLGNTDKISFLNWYELWLDESLKELH